MRESGRSCVDLRFVPCWDWEEEEDEEDPDLGLDFTLCSELVISVSRQSRSFSPQYPLVHFIVPRFTSDESPLIYDFVLPIT